MERSNALFKRCVLLILLAAVLLIPSNLIPVSQENIEAILRCVLPAFQQLALPAEKIGISKLRFVSPTYTSEDRDYLIRTIAFEASGESEEGKAAVAHVILTRKRSGKWGDTIKEVVTHPWQFESWMTKRAEMESLDVDDYRYRSAAQIADAVLAGHMSDPTTGATHFLNPTVVRKGAESSLPVLGHWRGLINRQAHFLCSGCGGMGGESRATLGNILLVLGFAVAELTLAMLEIATVR